ncbi:MAG: Abi-alpha family protein [Clostridiales bacterium]|nr:Abi-alpha family protein [Clostridiales bacterium]
MFEQQITAYLQPYGMEPAVQEEIADAVGRRLTQQPCQPAPALAGNILLQYGWAGEQQKARYIALLAAAMQEDSTVHPAFPFLVSQMDATDLSLLDTIGKQGRMPVLDCYLSRMKKSGGFAGKPCEDVVTSVELVTRMTEFLPEDGDYERVQAAMDNLLRLGLVDIRMYAERQALEDMQDNRYEDIYLLFQPVVDETVKQFCDRFPQYRERSVRLHAGNLTLTALGSRFLRVCK